MAKRKSDVGHELTDKELAKLERRIYKVYNDAAKEMSATVNDYFAKFVERDKEQMSALEAGKITKAEYTQWRLTQIGRGNRYRAMRDALAERYTKANEVAIAYVNDATPGIYSLNRNYAAYTIEQAGANVSFTLWDESTVKRMIKENPDVMPYYPKEKAIKRGIDLAYGKKQISQSVTSGILQGKSVAKIADDLQKRVKTMNRESAIRAARTGITAAENAGRQDTYEAAAEMGIEMTKEWVATLDDRTRPEHQDADGQEVPYDEPFEVGGEEMMYPGDSSGSGWNIYNCRCSCIAHVKGIDTSDAERRARDESGQNEIVENMTYNEWLESKR